MGGCAGKVTVCAIREPSNDVMSMVSLIRHSAYAFRRSKRSHVVRNQHVCFHHRAKTQ